MNKNLYTIHVGTAAFLLTLAAASFLLVAPVSLHAAELPAVITHDNQRPAGTLKDGKLVLSLRAGTGLWRPEKAGGPALTIDAFADGDGPLVAPAPLVRVPEGTDIVATIRNDLATPLQVHGLCEHDGGACAPIDVPASGVRTVEFRSGRAGTYAWWASSSGLPFEFHYGRDSQLSGAFIVDPPNSAPHADRIFVITEWASLTTEQLREASAADDPFMKAVSFRPQFGTLINGLSWPETERLAYHVGDSVRWRVVNASPEPHPLHLHGFYFDVDSMGDGLRDTRYAEDHKKRVVTQVLAPGATMSMTWTPERVGNWLFHCHIMEHVSPRRRLTRPAERLSDPHVSHEAPGGDAGHHDHETLAGMAGMVLGITVTERAGTSAADLGATSGSTASARKLTLTMQSEPTADPARPTYGFVLTEGVPRAASYYSPAPAAPPAAAAGPAPTGKLSVPGPTLVLRREEPVEITLVNQLPEATAVHWHGMELDNYYDGVHGFGGLGGRTTPLIAPGESFTVRFTPPRAGTFIYHTHMHDDRQLTSGLYGALLVLDPSTSPPYDPDTDHALVIGRDGVGPAPVMVLNGSRHPTFSWHAGTRHRLRLVNITRGDIVQVAVMSKAGPVTWRPLTKDGAPVPSGDAAPRAAQQAIAVGETYDFEYDAPASRQELWIEVRGVDGTWHVQGHAVLK